MNGRAGVYDKRLIFDHLPKAAGQAVNKWLRGALGAGCVTDNLVGSHRELIRRYGGEYSVISGHIDFNGTELDPRYQYVTLFREPVDRVISWLFFVLNNHKMEKLPELYGWSRDFVLSEGVLLKGGLPHFIQNWYVRHFSGVGRKNPGLSDDEKIASSLSVIKKYDAVGLYDEISEFFADVADLIGIPAPESVPRVNATASRPALDRISPQLLRRIVDLNQLDIRLYQEVVAWKKSQPCRERKAISASRWQRYDPVPLPDPSAIRDFSGSMVLAGGLETLRPDEQRKIRVKVSNDGNQPWRGDPRRPLKASYHWYNPEGKLVLFDGLRTELPGNGIAAHAVCDMDMLVRAPGCAGRFRLELTLLQEGVCWFEKKGFKSCSLEAEVMATSKMRKKIFGLAAILGVGLFLTGVLYAAGFILDKTVGGLMREDVRKGAWLMFDEQVGWIGRKGFSGSVPHGTFPRKIFVSINSDGYRDDDWDQKLEEARAGDLKKILVLGDSNIYGLTSEQNQTFPALAQKYADAAGLELKFFNAGIPAYGFLNYRRELDRLLERVHPDEIWLIVCGNDWGETALPYEHRIPARVYKPLYDENGILETEKVKRRPSLFFSQEFNIRPNYLTLALDYLSYLLEDICLFLKGFPTRWTSPLPISQYHRFIYDPVMNAKFPRVRVKIQKLIESMNDLLQLKGVKFRVIPIEPKQEKMMEGFRAAAGLDLLSLPEIFRTVIEKPWGKNFLEGHWNFIWGSFLARFLIDRIFPAPGGRDPAIFRNFIHKELKSNVDFTRTESFSRSATGMEWKQNRVPAEPRDGKKGHFALSNPFGGNAKVSLLMRADNGGFVIKEFGLAELCPLKTETFTLHCLDKSEDGVLFFRVEGSGLLGAEVKDPQQKSR